MAGPIYKLFMGKMSEAWYQLSEEEKDNIRAKRREIGQEIGGSKGILVCDSRWATEEWEFFGVQEFPDIEAVQKHTELLEEIGWFRYVDSVSILGTKH